MNLDEKPIKIKVENVSKVFGKQTKKPFRCCPAENKKEILKATGSTVGVNQANFDVYDGEIFVIMGLSGAVNQL